MKKSICKKCKQIFWKTDDIKICNDCYIKTIPNELKKMEEKILIEVSRMISKRTGK